MARPLRIEYASPIHHVMSRGNLRRSVFENEPDYQRLLVGLEQSFGRFGWELLSFVLTANYFHLLLRLAGARVDVADAPEAFRGLRADPH